MLTVRALEGFGIPSSTVYARCREGGPWQRVLPGVLLLASGHPTRRQLVVAALTYGGAHALVTGVEACRRHGIRRIPAAEQEIHLLVPHDRQLRSTEYVRIERTGRLPAAVLRDGIPLSPVARSCLDAARRIRATSVITELLAEPVQRGLCSVQDLRRELALASRRGTAAPRRVLGDVADGVRSAAEAAARRLCERSGLPPPRWNVPVRDAAGRLLGVADAWWDDVALAWEIDSFAWHLAPADYARTTQRAARLTAAGVVVLPILPTHLRDRPDLAIGELRAAYAVASRRPRPPVRADT